MKWFRRRHVEPEANVRHVEIWGHLEENNRFLRRVAGASVTWAFLALALGSYGVLVGLYRPLAFHVDPEGQASYVGRLREHVAPAEAEVRYVAKEFLRHYSAWNSLTVESDLADAVNLMTSELQREHADTLARYEKENGVDLVSQVKAQGVQTVFEFDAKKADVRNHDDKVFTAHLVGKTKTWPLNRVGEEAAFVEKTFEAQLTLVSCPRTEQTPNGLLVAKVSQRFFVPEVPPSRAGTALSKGGDR